MRKLNKDLIVVSPPKAHFLNTCMGCQYNCTRYKDKEK